MIKVFANFLLAIASMSVPVAAGSFMHVYTEDKKPTSFEELKFQTIIEIPDEEKVDEPEDELEEEEEKVTDDGKNNSAPTTTGGPAVNATSNTSNSGPQAPVTKTQAPSAPSQTTPQSNPVIAKPTGAPLPPPQPSAPVLPSPPQPQVPVPPPSPASAPGAVPPGGATPAGTVPNNTKGIAMTMDALKHFVDQEVSKNAGVSSADEFKANWQTAITALSTLDDDVKKSLLELFQLS